MSTFRIRRALRFAAALLASIGVLARSEAAPITQLGVYEEHASTTCSAAKTCTVYFSLLNAALRVDTVTCNFYVNGSTRIFIAKAVLGAGNVGHTSFAEAQYLAPFDIIGGSNTVAQYQLMAHTDHAYDKGQVPAVSVSTFYNGNIGLYCSIAGSAG